MHTYIHALYIYVYVYTLTHTHTHKHTHFCVCVCVCVFVHKVLEAEENTAVQMRGDVYMQVSVSV